MLEPDSESQRPGQVPALCTATARHPGTGGGRYRPRCGNLIAARGVEFRCSVSGRDQ